MDVQTHYQKHLAKFYSWMFGDFAAAVARNKSFFESHQIMPGSNLVALDLGAGPGFQAIALNQLGFEVHAVDTSQELLNEMAGHDPRIHMHCQDLRAPFPVPSAGVIACMGDTLTHLENKTQVTELIERCSQTLTPNGQLVISFRDLTRSPIEESRFFIVKSDDTRILTCFLEDDGDHVKVYDLLHEKTADGWGLSKSFYRKVKLDPAWVIETMKAAHLRVTASNSPSGLSILIGTKIP